MLSDITFISSLTIREIIIPLKGIIDTKSEINKLSKKKDNEHSELIKIQNKLNNDNFIEKAPKNVIEKFKKQEEEIKNLLKKLIK